MKQGSIHRRCLAELLVIVVGTVVIILTLAVGDFFLLCKEVARGSSSSSSSDARPTSTRSRVQLHFYSRGRQQPVREQLPEGGADVEKYRLDATQAPKHLKLVRQLSAPLWDASQPDRNPGPLPLALMNSERTGKVSSQVPLRGKTLSTVGIRAATTQYDKHLQRSFQGKQPSKSVERDVPSSVPTHPHATRGNTTATKETVIMAAAFSYKLSVFLRFLVPLRRVYLGQITLLVDNETATQEIIELCRRHNAKLRMVSKPSNPYLKRFELYAQVCKAPYVWCFASDFRDVYFQDDPFRSLLTQQSAAHLLLSEEYTGLQIQRNSFNKNWVSACFGHEGLEQVKNKQIICSGTIMGKPRGFAELQRKVNNDWVTNHRGCQHVGSDQGIVNYLFYTGQLTSTIAQAWGEGIVNTLGQVPITVKAKYLHTGGKFLVTNNDGTLSPVVHQYDRDGLNFSSVFAR